MRTCLLVQSMPDVPLILTSVMIIMVGIFLPHSPLGPSLGFTELPGLYWPLLLLTIFC
jgi:P-type Mg2+ transporter